MNKPAEIDCDILVVGAGFGGSLTALCLSQIGFNVCLVEKNKHPRFAIGESSTPIGDMILRNLANTYDLPWLNNFSRFGTWQQTHPEVGCGLKRGFSYFNHSPDRPFTTNAQHKNELLVAASSSDELSDTNWLRADFDAFLVKKVQEYGISYLDQTTITQVNKNTKWVFKANRKSKRYTFKCSFFIDATGNPNFLNRFLDISVSSKQFLTQTRALFSHFQNVTLWSTQLKKNGYSNADFPYNPDYSVMHHLMEHSWLWMIRFTDDRVSAGMMINNRQLKNQKSSHSPETEWNQRLASYPSIQQLFRHSSKADLPGRIISTGRLQRKLKKATGLGWTALPHSVGFVDPLHSTGIAHTLTGIERLSHILATYGLEQHNLRQPLMNYEKSVFNELALIDKLIAGCYDTLPYFDLFVPYSMLYFTLAIQYEQKRLKGYIPDLFLDAGDMDLQNIVTNSYNELQKLLKRNITQQQTSEFRQRIKQRISPYNTAGLLQTEAFNMYRHTAAE